MVQCRFRVIGNHKGNIVMLPAAQSAENQRAFEFVASGSINLNGLTADAAEYLKHGVEFCIDIRLPDELGHIAAPYMSGE